MIFPVFLKRCKLYASCPIGGVIVSHPAYEHIVNITNKSETEGLSTITSSDQNSFSSDKACCKVTIRLKNASKINNMPILFSISIDAYKM